MAGREILEFLTRPVILKTPMKFSNFTGLIPVNQRIDWGEGQRILRRCAPQDAPPDKVPRITSPRVHISPNEKTIGAPYSPALIPG